MSHAAAVHIRLLAVAAALACAAGPARAQERATVFISDLHMGLGRSGPDSWHPTEDFRWPDALGGFLEAVSAEGGGHTDLVMAGDFLELWQPPAGVECEGPNADYGCTLEEMQTILGAVIAAHAAEFQALAAFAAQDENCLHVIPGNHDAALTVDELWAPVAQALGAGGEGACVRRAADGIWTSQDGRIVAEHGHQIGWDANRYDDWPQVTKSFGGFLHIRRPWGESFVQSVFNAEEATYPLIDNLSPSSAGARYRMADRGLLGSAVDVARFLKFNLLETSVGQKLAALGEPTDASEAWDLDFAREELGYQLFVGGLAGDDELARSLREGETREARAVVCELDALTMDREALPDAEVEALCDKLAERGEGPLCRDPELGAAIEAALRSREEVVAPHVKERREDHAPMRTFVYGHTHAYEKEWPVSVSDFVTVSVLNDGAFQRVIDDDKFRALAEAQDLEPDEALKQISLEELPACYTSVRVRSVDGQPRRELRAWLMEEGGEGQFVDVCDPRCARVGRGCP